MISHIYKIENKLTGEYYIGKHQGIDQKKQKGKYWGSGDRIKNQINKYGKENFTYTVLVIGEEDYIYDIESKMVTKDLIENDLLCLNLVPGGYGSLKFINEKYKNCPTTFKKGKKKTEEHKEKLRKARAKQVFPIGHYERIAEKNKGTVWMNNGTQNKKIKLNLIETFKNNNWVEGRVNVNYNKEFREEQSLRAKSQWEKMKASGLTGHLIKI